MNGVTFKIAAIGLSTVFLSSLTFAEKMTKNIYVTKLGCMACHQGASMQPEKMRSPTKFLRASKSMS